MIDVRNFGAAGDGTTDDAPAIQAALDAATDTGGAGPAYTGWVYIPAGRYRLASGLPLRIGARTRLTLDPAATLIRDAPEAILINGDPGQTVGGYSGRGGIVIEGGSWDINAAAHPEPSGAIALAHAEDVTIRNLSVFDVPGWHAIEINSSHTVWIERCRFAGFVDTGDRDFSEAIQIDADTGAAAYPWFGPHDGAVCSDITVTRCWFGASGTPGTQPWPRGVGSHNTSEPNRHTNIKVLGCTFEALADAAIQTYYWDSAVIGDNIITFPSGEGIAVKDNSRYVMVHHNLVMDAGRTGIWVNTDCTQIAVRGNEIIGSGRAQTATHYGIRCSASCSYLRVTGNTVRKRASGNHARYGLSIDSSCSGVQRYGNDLRSSGATGNLQDISSSPVTAATDAV